MKAMTSDDLGIKSARLFFIYSFLCNGSQPRRDLPLDLIKLKILEDGLPGPKNKGAEDHTSRRDGLSAYIALNLPMGYRRLDRLDGWVGACEDKNDRLQVRIDPLLRLFPNGGSLTFKIVLLETIDGGRRITVDDVHKLHHLAPLVGNQQRYQFYDLADFGNRSLYQLYADLLSNEVSDWNERDGGEHKLLCVEHLRQEAKEGDGQDKNAISPKMPWVVTLLELHKGGKAHKAFCGDLEDYAQAKEPAEAKARAIRPYIPLIAPLLYRAPDFEHFKTPESPNFALEPAYYDHFKRLNSMNVEARLYVQMSRRSILCICDDRDKYPASYFLPALLDMCELVHTRWHSLIILHKVLDEKLCEFTREDNLTSPTINTDKGEVKKLQEIVRLVSMATTCLEDPAIFTVSGDALRNLHEEMNQTFQLELLARRALDKLKLLEQTYHHGLELGWTRHFEK